MWKHFRLQGIHFVLAFVHFDHSIGLTGINLGKLRRMHELTDGGRRKLVAVGDFNMDPSSITQSGILDSMGLRVVTAGSENTCKTASGSSLLDYIICDMDIAHLIGDLSLEIGPWNPHSSLRFSINRRCEHIRTLQLKKPKPLPVQKDDKGVAMPWQFEKEQWWELFNQAEAEAISAVDRSKNTSREEWRHVEQLGVQTESRDASIAYAQW